ncbi:MAG: hypothetical protein JWP41_4552 [Ramlibacter sp.]|nr:hypothetical protein [Ramlibacter sp.]
MKFTMTLSLLGLAALAGCATPPQPVGSPGKHLVYRDKAGNAFRQFDYPDDAFCRKVEALAGRSARCQAATASGLQARATLRYTPPGVLVEGHYADMSRCRADTATMSPGVELVNPCRTQ